MISDIANTHFSSSLFIDKIIGTYTGSFALNSPAAGATNTQTIPLTTNIPATTFYQGIFSLDAGANWNPFYTDLRHVESVDPSVNPQGSTQVYGESTAGTFNVIGKNVANVTATQFFDYTVLYKVALIAKPSQGTITPQPIGSDQFFNSGLNYQKIFRDTSTASSGTNQTVTINHNLGYVPRVRAFSETAGVMRGRPVTVNTTTASVFLAGLVTATVYIRVYYDE